MPIYEYACRRCGARFEAMRRTADRLAAPACTACGADETSLRFSAPGFVGAASGATQASCAAPSGSCCGGACLN